jgi:NitT/TauT family transport system ATP-binding protein
MFRVNIELKEFPTPQNQSKRVLQNLKFEIHDHEFLAIIGPSGCGKTTLLRILAGFDSDYQGTIEFSSNSGQSFQPIPLLGNIGYIPQEFSLFPWATVEENIRFGLKMKKMSKEHQTQTVSHLLNLVGMEEYRSYYPKAISGGMKQKIAICRALAINPTSNLIVMDEPFSAIDAQTRNALQVDLLKLFKDQHLTIVFITHNIDEAVFLSDRVLVMSPTPANIQQEITINIPHPRERTDMAFNDIRKRLLSYLNSPPSSMG